MDPNEFPTLEEAVSGNDNNNKTNDAGHLDKSTGLSSSWAEVAQPNQDKNNSDASSQLPKPELQPNHDNKSFATVAGHEKKQAEEFPTPQESLKEADTSSVPASAGVSDLLNNTTPITQDTTEPPNPDRSFADVASNKGFPTPEHDETQQDNDQPPLSDLPDVKDMLQQPSVHVPPVPASQSFAKVAAKEIPPEKRPLSERAQTILNQKHEEDPMAVNDDNFPTLGQSNLMAQENAGEDEKAVYSEISRLNQVNEDDTVKEQKDLNLKKSFADITSSNLENAPPPAVSHVDQLPVYDEETVYLENAKREERKNVQVPVGNNEQLIEQEELKQVQPTHEQKEQEKKNEKTYQKSREVVSGGKQKEEEEETDQMLVRLHTFDRYRTGKITIFNTMAALYRLGYSWFTIIPGAILMHLRLSPMTSPYGFPFIYRSLSDLILLPVYTRNLSAALKYNTPMQDKEQVQKMVKTYGHQKGLGFWDGIKAIRHSEQGHLRWWQLGLWAIHRIQWTLTYTMLHEPKSNVVSESTLVSLASSK
ncbi:uncharacterized protein B0P05DRAFT_548023 [Gilbertella persicaria]|uniref:uncharacterized protein n=1 Tax=Gilbertella persicaria TaxID=101096 RepID=UPI00221F64B5|nr:uncharacterized protein B0P05DRAFT_548023 [Gilbertella persicaria]KAI8074297.1 hypothetical protein B0P05DRAFT_548023 [Gilbertella persicaria]